MMIAILLFFTTQLAHGYGAIAYSDNGDETWTASADWNRPNIALAEDAAISGCKAKGGKDCKIVASTVNGCRAFAVINEGGPYWGVASGNPQYQAQQRAIDKCLTKAPEGSCIVRKSFCDNTNGFVQNGVDVTKPMSGATPWYCPDPDGYVACKADAARGFGSFFDRERYCRMSFC